MKKLVSILMILAMIVPLAAAQKTDIFKKKKKQKRTTEAVEKAKALVESDRQKPVICEMKKSGSPKGLLPFCVSAGALLFSLHRAEDKIKRRPLSRSPFYFQELAVL